MTRALRFFNLKNISMGLLGAATTLCFAPFHFWYLAPFLIALVFALLQKSTWQKALRLGWCYGFGLFISGTSWVYVSIHEFGETNVWLAALLTFLFAGFLAFFYGIGFALYRNFIAQKNFLTPFVFAASWTLIEVVRSTLFTGFPWLLLGNAFVQSPLAGLAPIGGVYSLSFVVVLSGVWLYLLIIGKKITAGLSLLIVWMICAFLPIHSLKTQGSAVKIALVQGNVTQQLKWSYAGLEEAINTYLTLTKNDAQGAELVIWPETALPMLAENARPYFEIAQQSVPHSFFLSGVLLQKNQQIFNAIEVWDPAQSELKQAQVYFKHHLVPFGEYVPFFGFLAHFFDLFHIPVPDLAAGPRLQKPLIVNGLNIGAAVCYEIVYADLVRLRAQKANLLLTISNDGWFGHSLGPAQHLQIAQMRALENNRYLIRATSNGITAVIGPDGRVIARLPAFKAAVLHAQVYPIEQETWFTFWGNWPILSLIFLIIAIDILQTRFKKRTSA